MFNADLDSERPRGSFNPPTIPYVQKNSLAGESFSGLPWLAYRRMILSALEQARNGDCGPGFLEKISKESLGSALPRDKAMFLRVLSQRQYGSDSEEKITFILRSLGSEHEAVAVVCELQRHGNGEVFRLIDSVETTEDAGLLSQSFVTSTLRSIATSLEDPKLRQKFLDPKLPEADLISVLKYASSAQRTAFVKDLQTISDQNRDLARFLQGKIDNVLHYTSSSERVSLMGWAREKGFVQRDGDTFAISLCKASRDLDDLVSLVRNSHLDENVLKIAPGLREYVALSVLGPELRSVSFPGHLPATATQQEIDTRLNGLKASFEGIIETCRRNSILSDTSTAQDYMYTARDNLNRLARDRESFGNSRANLIYIANECAGLAALEFRHGVNFTYGTDESLLRGARRSLDSATPISQGTEATGPRRWTLREISEMKLVLEAIPERHLLFTPLLREIQRVHSLGENFLGVRRNDGIIKIADVAIEHTGIENAYQGIDSLRIVLAHEIGHGIQIGRGPYWVDYPPGKAPSFHAGEPVYDFDEFTDLSGWQAIERKRFTQGATKNHVILDGKEYPVDKVIEHGGEKLVLRYFQPWNVLLTYNATAEFSSRAYSRSTPWEDYAEAFTEYLLLPHRLIKDAPLKFLHMERDFRKYENDAKVMDALEKALQNRARRIEARTFNGLGKVPEFDPWHF